MALSGLKHHPTRKASAKAQKKLKSIELDDDGCLALMVSGSNVNGINVGRAIPKYFPYVRESEAQNTTATLQLLRGGKLAQ